MRKTPFNNRFDTRPGINPDKSALVKKSLFELYENVVDLNEIKKFEARERKGKVSFFTAEDILKK